MPKWIFQKNRGDQQGVSMLIDISEMLSCGRRKSNGFDFRRKKPKYFGHNQTKMVIATEFSQRNYKMPYHVASLFVLPCTWKCKVYTEHFVSAQYVDSIIVQLLELSKRPPWHESSCIR